MGFCSPVGSGMHQSSESRRAAWWWSCAQAGKGSIEGGKEVETGQKMERVQERRRGAEGMRRIVWKLKMEESGLH